MIQHNRATAGSSTGPLELTDPTGVYEFEVVIEAAASTPHREPQCEHRVHATRTYHDVSNIGAVWPTNPDVANLIQQLINMRVIDQSDGNEIEGHGIDITVVLEPDITGHYNPVDILLDNRSINQHRVSAGFWRIDIHLQEVLSHQSKGLIHGQIAYSGNSDNKRTSACI